jgi:hypothetical protein
LGGGEGCARGRDDGAVIGARGAAGGCPGDPAAAAGECNAGERGAVAAAPSARACGDGLNRAKRNCRPESLLGGKDKGAGRVEGRSAFTGDDKFGSPRTRPRGVDRKFKGEDPGAATPLAGVLDPIFRLDLNALLWNTDLPTPINWGTKFAIKFHRVTRNLFLLMLTNNQSSR